MTDLATMSRAALQRWIVRNWTTIVRTAVDRGATGVAGAKVANKPTLLTSPSAQAKLRESLALGQVTAGLQLSPSTESGRNLCPWATETCSAFCLSNAGQNSMSPALNARLARTALYFGAREAFNALLRIELRAHVKAVERFNADNPELPDAQACFRSDVLSDIALGRGIALEFGSELVCYDYTKSVKRALSAKPTNYSVCYSHASRETLGDTLKVLRAGGVVSVVFAARPKIGGKHGRKADPLPKRWHGFEVVDGDSDDAINLAAPGTVRGLRFKIAKGWKSAVSAASAAGFVEPVDSAATRALAVL